MSRFCLTFLLIISFVSADVYLHFPPGSNDRVNENTADRTNENNAFNSQNNNKGGYNVPDATAQPYGTNASLQYYLQFFQSGATGATVLRFVWTNQHGCGGNEETNSPKQVCNIILQYMCQDDDIDDNNLDKFRNGVNTVSQDYTRTKTSDAAGKLADVNTTRRLHESWNYYDRCYNRERNKGLFTADKNLQGNGAIYTRQNSAGTKYGYECPEERDYWPYISPWADIATLTSNTDLCSFYQQESFNVKPRYDCIEILNNVRTSSKYNNAGNCTANGGRWSLLYSYLEKASAYTTQSSCERTSSSQYQYKWAIPHDTMTGTAECLVLLPQEGPSCGQAYWSRSNYLGLNSDAEQLTYSWTLPSFPSNNVKRCIARIRYNISTFDYDLYNINASSNGAKSPVKGDPVVTVDVGIKLQINLNTNQLGRTFQDRTHIFKILPRPSGIGDSENIYNWNMLGKRGNIVQTYPAVEYDFTPRNLEINRNDLIHIQWAGSNTHNNEGNSDGEPGAEGQGNPGTDRSNLVEIRDRDENYPYPYEQTTFWKNVNVRWSPMNKSNDNIRKDDLALYFASSGYYRCQRAADCTGANSPYTLGSQTKQLDSLLDVASASFAGAVLKVNPGTYHMMCTRNNNFSNRAQKGTLTVT
ncbi:unnamed protein product [Rotaria socialis]|uniref:Protein DD3-3 n=1 Tax=Rotaria socialis TaxID=392032 RepID=A0A819X2G4_9BILA|nr:unnamed protein product [Rotaria socialis]CAF4134107.1 unnamed protein product [Rotaria socialis]